MKKALAILLTAVMLLGVLTACGSKKDDAADDTQNTEDTDKAAADNVAALIDAIYVQERTDETDAQCEAAKAAWDALTDEQKAMVEGEEASPEYFGLDTGDASKDDPRNQDDIGENELLVVSFGTSYNDSRVNDIKSIEDALQEAYPDWSVRRAFTAQIIINHIQARDGVELARKHRLPEPIIDMIRQHHGDTPVMYFYAKAVKMLGEENVDIRDFRYDGPKPQTAEAAILMLSDTVEAAVRALPDPTQEKISALIRKLVRGKMEDGQLDECTLTFRDIGKICSAFETVLQGVFHERIEYPSVDLSRAQHHSEQKQAEQKTEAKP